jgi:YHS domain-containing protein
VLRYVIKMIGQSMRDGSSSSRTREARPGGRLEKDPVCGTFVAPDTAVVSVIGGRTLHFCSNACRDRYRS